MDRFVSTFINKIDAKGRVSVPAPFRAVLERDGYAGAASTATPRSMLRRSMQAARALRTRSTGFSTACRIIRTSATSCLSRSMVTCTSLAIDQDGRIVLPEALRAHAGLSTHVAFVGLGRNSRCGSPRASRSGARAPARRSGTIANCSARGAALIGGPGGEGRSTGMNARARQPAGRG